MDSTYTRRFKFFCIAEGISWIALIIAMVVKYTQDMPQAVRWPGLVHGFLFIGYIVTAGPMFTRLQFPVERAQGIYRKGTRLSGWGRSRDQKRYLSGKRIECLWIFKIGEGCASPGADIAL